MNQATTYRVYQMADLHIFESKCFNLKIVVLEARLTVFGLFSSLWNIHQIMRTPLEELFWLFPSLLLYKMDLNRFKIYCRPVALFGREQKILPLISCLHVPSTISASASECREAGTSGRWCFGGAESAGHWTHPLSPPPCLKHLP